jgi:hypothetical protein
MSDDELLARFEALDLPDGGFRHRDHLRLAWIYLHRFPVLEVLARLSGGLSALARSRGAPGHYHQTITWAYIFLIGERLERTGRDHSWAEFAESHPDLLNGSEGILRRYYRDETLRSNLAREIFVLPDRWISISDDRWSGPVVPAAKRQGA